VIFGIDYDGTYAVDPHLFDTFIALLRARGHSAVLVTGRSDDEKWGKEVRDAVAKIPTGAIPVVFAGIQWKRSAAAQAGYRVDVWIDDFPEYIAPQDQSKSQYKQDYRPQDHGR
jgi:predicted O-linked N-acetylglucosamine transferase (SPINDLY family)